MNQLLYKSQTTILQLFFFTCMFSFSCKKSVTEGGASPVVSGISPTTGPFGTVVTINGINFGDSASGITASVNGRIAVIKYASSTSTKLEIIVPDSAGTGNVSVKTKYGQATGPVFEYVYTYSPFTGTFAGNGTAGYSDGSGVAAQFYNPHGIAIDGANNIYVADGGNHRIRKITPAGLVSTIAGSGTPGFVDGQGTAAQFYHPVGISIDRQDNIYVADQSNHSIRKITPSGWVSTLAGSGKHGYLNEQGKKAYFNSPVGVISDGQDNLYVTDGGNHRIRKITPAGVVSTWAGSGVTGFADGSGTSAQFYNPLGITIDGNDNLYIAEYSNHSIRKVTPAGIVSTIVGSGKDGLGYVDGPVTTAKIFTPSNITIDNQGNLYFTEWYGNRIRKITPSGWVSTVVASGTPAGFSDGIGPIAKFRNPDGIVLDGQGNIYIADWYNHSIRKITTVRH
jgi:sugar lactone lactonase YvrE